MRPINVEVPDAREGRVRSFIVRMELGELSYPRRHEDPGAGRR